ncbi:MAG: UTP--glucose-1-phosphate uridylyltransferase [Candidatus Goldbacteria bacterium]|nr:UTP--glucose-1-phosphate uridylyltransferase [Candidatus Goldiibacteriota bacterium]
MKIRKAVIPVAGLGTRFLPYTKAIPKEMLPIMDLPVIHFIVEEAVNSGINEILLITSKDKRCIEDYFRPNKKLENFLKLRNKKECLQQLRRVPDNFKLYSVIQKEPKGLGHAILLSEKFVNGEYFTVFLPDDLIFSKKPVIQQMMDIFTKYKKPVVAIEQIDRKKISSYGIIKPKKVCNGIYDILDIIEKPSVEEAFSNLGIVGRYILPPEIFKYIRKQKTNIKKEIQLTDSLKELINTNGILGYEFEGVRCDTGDKTEYILAIFRYASIKKELTKKFKKEIKKIFKI